jgi:hypothetical protein
VSNNVTVTNRDNLFGSILTSDFSISEITDIQSRIPVVTNGINASIRSATLVNYEKMGSIKESDYSIINVSSFLPFRVAFTNITVKPYDVNNIAPVGVSIIGVNNYIL